MEQDLRGKRAIVTGGSGVLGGAMAMGLAREGVKLGILGRTRTKVEARVAEIQQAGGEAMALVADVLSEEELETARSRFEERWGAAQILVNCAGGNQKGATIMPEETFFDLDLEAFEQVNRLNLMGTVLPCRVWGRGMAAHKSGCIVNISSMAAQLPLTRVVGYSAAKAAIDNFTRWLAVEMAGKYGPGIRVNAIAPGFFITEQNRDLLQDQAGGLTPRGETIVSQTPMRRFGRPEELTSTLLWLCGAGASFVTGTVIPVDGGFSAFSGV